MTTPSRKFELQLEFSLSPPLDSAQPAGQFQLLAPHGTGPTYRVCQVPGSLLGSTSLSLPVTCTRLTHSQHSLLFLSIMAQQVASLVERQVSS